MSEAADVAAFFGLSGPDADRIQLLARRTVDPDARPDPAALERDLLRLGGRPEEVGGAPWLAKQLGRPEVRWLFDHCQAELVQEIGAVGSDRGWPTLRSGEGELDRWLYIYILLAGIPTVRAFHRSRGIPDDVGWASLADLTQQMAVHQQIFGCSGIHTQGWLNLPFRGLLYRLGRLQFNLGVAGPGDVADSTPFAVGDPVLGAHIPAQGPLADDQSGESLRAAARFFPTHFPEHRTDIVICQSWLLDPQLADELPIQSNIVRFGRRFALTHRGEPADRAILEFVFRAMAPDLDRLPQRTTLQRAVVSQLRAGGHWYAPSGWLRLSDS